MAFNPPPERQACQHTSRRASRAPHICRGRLPERARHRPHSSRRRGIYRATRPWLTLCCSPTDCCTSATRVRGPGIPSRGLRRVLVFRGEPSPEHDPRGYATNQAQKSHWERDERVRATLRPLKYLRQGHLRWCGSWCCASHPQAVSILSALSRPAVRESIAGLFRSPRQNMPIAH
jgi:hypothetical protein